MSERLSNRLAELKAQGRAGFVPFIMAGDPNLKISAEILHQLPDHGADIIELGIPFSDPMADGPTIQAAGLRALNARTKVADIFKLVADFRTQNDTTPIILMGYYNPLYHIGLDTFMSAAKQAGVDGLIIVDVPSEEIAPMRAAADKHAIDIVRLIAPTSLENRLPAITQSASGFVYYIAIKGITGTASANMQHLAADVAKVKAATDLPVAVGFGIKTPQDVKEVAAFADLVVVGSALVALVEKHGEDAPKHILTECKALSDALR